MPKEASGGRPAPKDGKGKGGMKPEKKGPPPGKDGKGKGKMPPKDGARKKKES
jgi:hypothetical protein